MGQYSSYGARFREFLNEAFQTSPTLDVFVKRLAEHELVIVDEADLA